MFHYLNELVFWFFQKRLHPVPSFFVTPFRFCLFRICVILWVRSFVFCLYCSSIGTWYGYPSCQLFNLTKDIHQAVEPVQGGRYMLTVKTPKLHTLKLKVSLTSISTIFLVCSLFLNSTLHSSYFTQTRVFGLSIPVFVPSHFVLYSHLENF